VYEEKKHFLPKDMLVDRKYKKEETNNNQTGESPDNTSNIPSKISIYRKIIWWQLLLLNVFFSFYRIMEHPDTIPVFRCLK
jgi:hypothetical protein